MCGFDGSFIFMKGKGIRLVQNIAIFNELKGFFVVVSEAIEDGHAIKEK